MSAAHRYTLPATGIEALAPREIEVLQLYPELGTQLLIAERMGVSIQTIKNYGTRILRKLDVAHLGQAAVLFDRWTYDRDLTWPDIDRRKGAERRTVPERRVS